MLLGVGAAFAQGLPSGTVPPVYWSGSAANQLMSPNLNDSSSDSK
jgi:hypothetical protein